MYQDIYKYATEKGLTIQPNRTKRKIAAYIVIDKTGQFQHMVELIDTQLRTEAVCPDVGTYYSSGQASLICDKRETIFGDKKHESFIALAKEGAEHSEEVKAIYTFVKEVDSNPALMEEVCEKLTDKTKAGDFISFRIDGINAEESSSWCDWFDKWMDAKTEGRTSNDTGISCLSGREVQILGSEETFPMARGSWAGTGIPIFSNAHSNDKSVSCAFRSYGAKGVEGCQMSREEADIIKVGLSHLMDSERNHNDTFGLIYWYEEKNAADIIGRVLNYKDGNSEEDEIELSEKEQKKKQKITRQANEDYKKLMESIFEGTSTGNGKPWEYHLMRFKLPEKGRIYIFEDIHKPYLELEKNIRRWYEDSKLAYPSVSAKTISNVYSMLYGLLDHGDAKDKWGEINNEYGRSKDKLVNAIFFGEQIPRRMYEHALRRFDRSVIGGRFSGRDNANEKENPTRIALSTIKAYLIREGITMSEKLDTGNDNVAYQCGRWLAALDRLQQASAGKSVGVPIGQKLYKGAKHHPSKILSLAADNKEIYLGRIKNNGTRIFFEKLLGEISEKIGTRYPDSFTITDMGAFDMGYAQQHQALAFFSKEKSNIAENDDITIEEE